jgi:hypothetical protein
MVRRYAMNCLLAFFAGIPVAPELHPGVGHDFHKDPGKPPRAALFLRGLLPRGEHQLATAESSCPMSVWPSPMALPSRSHTARARQAFEMLGMEASNVNPPINRENVRDALIALIVVTGLTWVVRAFEGCGASTSPPHPSINAQVVTSRAL